MTWPFTFGVRLGWLTCSAPNPDLAQAAGRAYFLRGQAVVFSGGFGMMCTKLRQAGWWAEDLRCVGDRWVRKHLAETAPVRGPLVLVGHSCGGRYALHTAGELAKRGIAVDLVVCVDVAGPFDVAANVRHAANLFRSRARIYPARPLRAAQGSQAQITNVDLDAPGSPIDPAWLHHLNITGSPGVQSWILDRILKINQEG